MFLASVAEVEDGTEVRNMHWQEACDRLLYLSGACAQVG